MATKKTAKGKAKGKATGFQNQKKPKRRRSENLPNLGEYAKTGGPGRPKGALNGRQLLLQELDDLLGNPKNLKRARDEMQKVFDAAPLPFILKFVYPLMPKNVDVSGRLDSESELGSMSLARIDGLIGVLEKQLGDNGSGRAR